MVEVTNGPGGQRGGQVLDFVAGQPDQPGRWWLAGVFGHGRHHQEGVGEHGKGGAPVLTGDDPSAIIQARLHAILTDVIGRLEQPSDGAMDASPADDGRERATSQAEDAAAVPDGTPGR